MLFFSTDIVLKGSPPSRAPYTITMLTIWDGSLISSQWIPVVLPSSPIFPTFFCLLCFVRLLHLYRDEFLHPIGVQLTHTQTHAHARVGESPKWITSYCSCNGELNALNAFTTFNHYLTQAVVPHNHTQTVASQRHTTLICKKIHSGHMQKCYRIRAMSKHFIWSG